MRIIIKFLQFKPTKGTQCVIITKFFFNIHKLIRVWSLTGPSSGSAQLCKTIVRPYCHPQYVQMSEVDQYMILSDVYVRSNWSSL